MGEGTSKASSMSLLYYGVLGDRAAALFWLEWSYLTPPNLCLEQLENIKHGHEVGRNVWLALVVLLSAIFGIKWPGAEQ